jgi:hypothetical protein
MAFTNPDDAFFIAGCVSRCRPIGIQNPADILARSKIGCRVIVSNGLSTFADTIQNLLDEFVDFDVIGEIIYAGGFEVAIIANGK